MNSVKDRSVIVSGNAEDLGWAAVRELVRAGAKVVLIDEPSAERDAFVAELTGGGAELTAVDVDFADAASTKAAAVQAIAVYGTPRALIHTTAPFREVSMAELDVATWHHDLDSLLQSAFILSHTVWPLMTQAGEGSINYVSSGSALNGFANEAPYVAGKHGQEGLMKVLALEGKPFGVAVNTITPGAPIDGPLTYTYPDAVKAVMVQPAVVAPAFVWAAGLTPAESTGQRLNAFQIAHAMASGASMSTSEVAR